MLADPPSNGEYLAAAYVVATLILVGYWINLWRRAKKSIRGKAGKRESEDGKAVES